MGTGRSGLSKGLKNTTRDLYREWSSQNGAESDMRIDINRWTKDVSKDAMRALWKYTGSFYKQSNPILRAADHDTLSADDILAGVSQKESAEFVAWLKNMDEGLGKYKNTKAFVGYRGSGYALMGGRKTFEELKAMVGSTVRDNGHMSISTVRGHEFGGDVMYEVRVPKGTGIGAYVGKLSQHSSEAEFLLNRGTIFKVVQVTMRGHRPYVVLQVYGRY